MYRSIIVIVLAIVCGLSAAIGVNRLTPPPAPESEDEDTTPVFVAAQAISRGAKIEAEDIKLVQWPTEHVPQGIAPDSTQIVGRSALSAIVAEEPIFLSKVSDSSGRGFISNAIDRGMRACTIQTSGPSASVAGFVRPDDHVDVLLNLRGSSSDETGGGTALTLLQDIKILAINDVLDVNDGRTMNNLWMKEDVKSVTLLVTPEQSLQLSLGQAAGTLSLALRNIEDPDLSPTRPLTLTQVRTASPRFALANSLPDSNSGVASESQPKAEDSSAAEPSGSPGDSATTQPSDAVASRASVAPPAMRPSEREAPPTYIRTLRGSQVGQVRVVTIANP